MRSFILAMSIFSASVSANGFDSFVENIRNGQLSISDIQALYELDKSGEQVGYGLCVAAGKSPTIACDKDGSVGYGLCVVAGKSPTIECKKTGTIGYGLCVLSGKSPTIECKSNS